MNNHQILLNIAGNIKKFSYNLTSNFAKKLSFRPLLNSDVGLLTNFLESLSNETRRLSTFHRYDSKMSQELCDAINKYDKFRHVLINTNEQIIGLIEFTLDIPFNDLARYLSYGLNLNSDKTCRFGPTLADNYQNQGVGSSLFPYIIKIAESLGRNSIILYGGVLADNVREIKFYKKQHFRELGRFVNSENMETVDMVLEL